MWEGQREHSSMAKASDAAASFALLFRRPYVRYTFALLFVNFFGMFAWWGLFTWLPP